MDNGEDKYRDRPLVWTTRDDNYLNDNVQLKQATYDIHIINDGNRKELVGEEATLKNVVENPHYIYKDKYYENRIHYCGHRMLDSVSKVLWVDITVDTAENPPDICTSMPQRRTPKITKENVLYDSTKTIKF